MAAPFAPHLVLGAGRAGLAAIGALREQGAPVLAWDGFDGDTTRARRDELARDGVELVLGAWDPALLARAPFVAVVKSPGVALDAPPVRDARAAGIDVVDELEIGVRRSRRELVAVTGTDGKSTVAALVAAALSVGGATVPVAGNTEFGPPLSAAPAAGGPLVVEASSYQLAFTAPAFARLAVLTNITEEHLHRHGSLAAYAQAKRRAFLDDDGRAVPSAVVGIDDAHGRALASELAAAGATVATVGGAEAAAYRVRDVRSELDGAEVRADTPAGPLELALRLPGSHNARNALAALAACDLLGVDRRRRGRGDRVLRRRAGAVGVDRPRRPVRRGRRLRPHAGCVASRAHDRQGDRGAPWWRGEVRARDLGQRLDDAAQARPARRRGARARRPGDRHRRGLRRAAARGGVRRDPGRGASTCPGPRSRSSPTGGRPSAPRWRAPARGTSCSSATAAPGRAGSPTRPAAASRGTTARSWPRSSPGCGARRPARSARPRPAGP